MAEEMLAGPEPKRGPRETFFSNLTNGLPAREEVIRRANAWLDEAEQLAAAK